MKIYVNVKRAGSRRSGLEPVAYETDLSVCTLRDVIAFLVGQEVAKFNRRSEAPDVLRYLCERQIDDAAETGKVGFHAVYRESKADEGAALQTALECFRDGLVRIFLNGEEATALEQPLTLRDGDVFTLMRLTFLSGRMW